MSKVCLVIGGPKDGSRIAIEDRYKPGEHYRVVILPKMRLTVEATDPIADLQYDSFLYTIDVIRSPAADHWYMRPYGCTVSDALARLFENYWPMRCRWAEPKA